MEVVESGIWFKENSVAIKVVIVVVYTHPQMLSKIVILNISEEITAIWEEKMVMIIRYCEHYFIEDQEVSIRLVEVTVIEAC